MQRVHASAQDLPALGWKSEGEGADRESRNAERARVVLDAPLPGSSHRHSLESLRATRLTNARSSRGRHIVRRRALRAELDARHVRLRHRCGRGADPGRPPATLRWTGVGPGLRLGLDVDARTLVHDAGVTVGAAALWNRFDDMGILFSQGLHYALLARVRRQHPVGVLAGVIYRYESLDGYYADWDDSFLYWFSTHTLAPAVAFEVAPSSVTRFWARIEIPVVGLLSRPPEERVYKVDPIPYFGRYPELTNRHPVLVGPTDLFAPTLSARSDHFFGRHFGLRLGVDLWYRRALDPRDFFALGERLLVELRHAF